MLLAAGAFAASEYTGVTNFTGIGSGGGDDKATPQIDFQLPPGLIGGIGGGVGDGGSPIINIPSPGGAGGTAGLANALMGLQDQFYTFTQNERIMDTIDQINRTEVPDPDFTGVENPWKGINLPDVPNMPTVPNPFSLFGGGNGGTVDVPDVPGFPTPDPQGKDTTGSTGPNDVRNPLVFAMEASRGASDATNAVLSTLGLAGNTATQTANALTGKKFTTKNTFRTSVLDEEPQTKRLYSGSPLSGLGGFDPRRAFDPDKEFGLDLIPDKSGGGGGGFNLFRDPTKTLPFTFGNRKDKTRTKYEKPETSGYVDRRNSKTVNLGSVSATDREPSSPTGGGDRGEPDSGRTSPNLRWDRKRKEIMSYTP
jgi:hypothetical protein